MFVQAPYDQDVTDQTVFWNASGLDVALDASGLRVDAQSLATVVAGGLAFDVRDPHAPARPAVEGTTFELYDDRAHAMAPPDGVRVTAKLRFHGDIRGVGVGTTSTSAACGSARSTRSSPATTRPGTRSTSTSRRRCSPSGSDLRSRR